MRNPKSFKLVNDLVDRSCAKHGIRVYQYANCGNHLHLLLRIRSRAGWGAFIRELTGAIGSLMGGRFWACRPFTRIVRGWRRAFRIVKFYVHLNHLESEGVISRRDEAALAKLRAEWLGSA